MILITSIGEFLLYFTVIFCSFIKKKKKVAAFSAGIHFQWIKNYEGKQFSTGSVGKLTVIKWNT